MTDPFEKAKEEAEKLRLRKLFEKKQSEAKPVEIDKTVEAKLVKEHAKPAEEPKEESKHAKILREHGGLESNIPIHHEYWRIRP